MNNDYLRFTTVAGAAGTTSVPAAGYTGASALITGWIDTAEISGPIVVRGYVAQDTNLSGTLSIESSSSSAAVAANAGTTVTADDDFVGGRATQGVNATGGLDFVAADGLDSSLSYKGSSRYIRGHLTLNNGTNAAVAKDVALVVMGMPKITPAR